MFHSSPQAGAWNSPHTPRKQKNRTPKIGFEHDLSVESLQRMATLEVHVAAFGTTHSWKNWRRLKNWNWIASLLPRVAVRRNPAKSCCTTSTDNSSWSRGYCCKWRLQQMSFHFFVDRLTVPSKHHALFMVVCLTTEHFKSWYPWDDDPNCLTFWGGPNGHQLTICLNTYANNYPNPKHIQSWKKTEISPIFCGDLPSLGVALRKPQCLARELDFLGHWGWRWADRDPEPVSAFSMGNHGTMVHHIGMDTYHLYQTIEDGNIFDQWGQQEDCYGGAMVDMSFENSFSSQLNDEVKNDDILWWNHQNQIFLDPKTMTSMKLPAKIGNNPRDTGMLPVWLFSTTGLPKISNNCFLKEIFWGTQYIRDVWRSIFYRLPNSKCSAVVNEWSETQTICCTAC